MPRAAGLASDQQLPVDTDVPCDWTGAFEGFPSSWHTWHSGTAVSDQGRRDAHANSSLLSPRATSELSEARRRDRKVPVTLPEGRRRRGDWKWASAWAMELAVALCIIRFGFPRPDLITFNTNRNVTVDLSATPTILDLYQFLTEQPETLNSIFAFSVSKHKDPGSHSHTATKHAQANPLASLLTSLAFLDPHDLFQRPWQSPSTNVNSAPSCGATQELLSYDGSGICPIINRARC
ncbi:uncharacterized protein K444DRAFT_10013 [Hyaloscypha bicolor E]|uniref:Uncharacterized protein n=1 Tax=Hyaloscypha bicolor E TaxID=1095630 RepID=A0A2J6TW30_9HELO|nr:uncharacterized protein K444DRAFT_10013 [Hyaloscypha bicolor E]PMD67229.1 hypothetical protein K444DRAFT_10013 [Hyaloscypha bicolor E]